VTCSDNRSEQKPDRSQGRLKMGRLEGPSARETRQAEGDGGETPKGSDSLAASWSQAAMSGLLAGKG
jgi:hypothetical protein